MKYTAGLVYLLILIKSSLCDIPVHCLKSHIQGKWKIFASFPSEISDLYKHTCGHSMPSHEKDAYIHRSIIPKVFFDLELKSNDEAILSISSDIGLGKKVFII
jgi:hypothetical protein